MQLQSLDCSCREPSGGEPGGRAGTDDVSAAVKQLPSKKKRTCRATTVHRKSDWGVRGRKCTRQRTTPNGPLCPVITPPADLPMDILFSFVVLKSPRTRSRGCWLPSHCPFLWGPHFAASHTQRRKPGRQRLGDSDPSKQLVVVLSGCRKHLGPQTPLKTTGGADSSRHYQS